MTIQENNPHDVAGCDDNVVVAKRSPRELTAAELIVNFANIPRRKTRIGSLTLTVQADPLRGQAIVTAALANATVGTQMLTLANPTWQLDVANGQASATGTILLKLEPSPRFSVVNAAVVAIDQGKGYPFKGDLESWVTRGQPVVGDYEFCLTAGLATLTTVRGAAANVVDFSFRVSKRSVASMIATQLAPVQKWPNAIVAGDIKIDAGAQISLTIPTKLETGFLFLMAKFCTLTTPPTQIGTSVANWSLPLASIQG